MSAEPARLPVQPGQAAHKAPRHLRTDGRRLWRRVVAEYLVDDAHALELLRLACEAIDRAAQARDVIAAEGMTRQGRWGPVTHPAIAIERDSSLRAARLLRELGLLDIPESRPPSRWHAERSSR